MTLLSKLHVGADAYQVVAELVGTNSAIQEISVFPQLLAPLLSERAKLTQSEQQTVNSAMKLKDQSGLPFWDAVMVSATSSPESVDSLFDAATFHNPQTKHQDISTENLTAEQLRRLSNENEAGAILAISSQVKCADGRFRHIPQIDFHCRASAENQKVAISLLRNLSQRGYLLASGKSYHFYGIDLLNDDELGTFFGRVLLFSPIVDRAWIAHQLIEGRSALRLSSRKEYGGPPQLIAKIGI